MSLVGFCYVLMAESDMDKVKEIQDQLLSAAIKEAGASNAKELIENYGKKKIPIKPKKHGGQRKGSGRPEGSFVNVQKKEPTKVIRVPVSKIPEIEEIIKKR